MREFLTPEDNYAFETNKTLPAMHGACVFCMRLATQRWECESSAHMTSAPIIIQPYRNKCDEPGEYRSQVCFKGSCNNRINGIVAPYVRHHASLYTPVFDIVTSRRGFRHTDAAVFFGEAPAQ